MGQQLVDDSGISVFIDDNGVSFFVDDLGNFLGLIPINRRLKFIAFNA